MTTNHYYQKSLELKKSLHITRKGKLTESQLDWLDNACEDKILVILRRQDVKAIKVWQRACESIDYPCLIARRSMKRHMWNLIKLDKDNEHVLETVGEGSIWTAYRKYLPDFA